MPIKAKTGVLYLDVEGGWGGSSRSLFYLIEALDRERFDPVVLTRKEGPAHERYKNIGVKSEFVPALAAFRPAVRKNAVAFVMFLISLFRFVSLLRLVKRLVREHKIVLLHVNHEGLALTGYLLSRRLDVPLIVHLRTSLEDGFFSRLLYRAIMRSAAHMVCISEPVKAHAMSLAGSAARPDKVSVVHNAMPAIAADTRPMPEFSYPPERFRVLSLSNFSPNRGVDRIVDVAAALRRRGDNRFAFYLCGKSANFSALTRSVKPFEDQIRLRVKKLGLHDVVFFPGHISHPDRALISCDVLIRLWRLAHPWGRDIIEAMRAGLPIITVGKYQGFVADGENGFVDAEYQAERIADHLQLLASHPDRCREIGTVNRQKAEHMFDPLKRSREIEAIYRQVLGRA